MGKAPSFVSIVRRCRGLAVMTTCSVIPRARMMGAPKTKNVCQSLGLATIIAKTVTTIERPIKRPATKLPACRNLARGFFMIHSDPECDGCKPNVVNPLAPLRRNKVAQRLADRDGSSRSHLSHRLDQGFGCNRGWVPCFLAIVQRISEILQFPVIVERRRSLSIESQPF